MSERDELSFLSDAFGQFGEMGAQLARRGLDTINLGDPSAYVLGFVSMASSARAQTVIVRTEANDFILEHDGQALNQKDLHWAAQGGSGAAPTGAARFLAIALRAAGKVNMSNLIVKSWLGSAGLELKVGDNKAEMKSLAERFSPDIKLTVQVRIREAGRLRQVTKLVSKFSGSMPEAGVIEQRCAFAPFALELNGRLLSNRAELGPCLVWRWLRNKDLEVFQGVRPPGAIAAEEDSPGPFSAVLGIATEREEATGLTAILHGVTYPVAVDLGFPGASALVYCPALKLDLEGMAPANDEVLTSLVNKLRQVFDQMVVELFQKREDIAAGNRLMAATLFDYLASHTNNPEETEACLRAALDMRSGQMRPSEPQMLNTQLALGDLLFNQSRVEEASEVYRRVIPVWEGEAQNHLAKHRHNEAVESFERALELLEKITPPGDPELADRYQKLGEVCSEHRHPKAERFYRRALAVRRDRGQEDPLALAESLYGLAEIFRRQKMWSEARPLAEEGLQLMEKLKGENAKELAPYLKLLSKIVSGLGDYAAATDLDMRATMIRFKR